MGRWDLQVDPELETSGCAGVTLTSLSITATVLITDYARGRQDADAASGASRLRVLLSACSRRLIVVAQLLVLISAYPVCVLVTAFETRPTD